MDALRTIVVGTELGSFARAASQLGRSQSAVSMQLKKLEQQAGQPLFRRNGRGLVPTEAGDALLAYARRIIALNDEAAASVGATAMAASVRFGLPQDFVDDILPDVITRFARQRPGVHVEVHAGRNYSIAEDVSSGRLDVAIAFSCSPNDTAGMPIASLPMLWLARGRFAKPTAEEPIALVLFDHPCLFRQVAFESLESKGLPWRLALTTPSLPTVWAALRSGHGVSIRTGHQVPPGIRNVGPELGLPKLPSIGLRMLTGNELSPAATDLREILDEVVRKRVIERSSGSRR